MSIYATKTINNCTPLALQSKNSVGKTASFERLAKFPALPYSIVQKVLNLVLAGSVETTSRIEEKLY